MMISPYVGPKTAGGWKKTIRLHSVPKVMK